MSQPSFLPNILLPCGSTHHNTNTFHLQTFLPHLPQKSLSCLSWGPQVPAWNIQQPIQPEPLRDPSGVQAVWGRRQYLPLTYSVPPSTLVSAESDYLVSAKRLQKWEVQPAYCYMWKNPSFPLTVPFVGHSGWRTGSQSRLAAITWNSALYWKLKLFFCLIARIVRSAVAIQLGSPQAASRSSIKDGMPYSSISPFCWTCGKMPPKIPPLPRSNVYHIFHCSLGKLAGLCRIAIRIWAIQPLNWVRSHPGMPGESGIFRPPSSRASGRAGATLSANMRALASCVRRLQSSSPDCCASRVMTANCSHSSLSVTRAAGLPLALSCSVIRHRILVFISVWLHRKGRNCWACRSVICFWDAIICAGWWQTICMMLPGSVYCATLLNTLSAVSSSIWLAVNSMSSTLLLTSPPMVAWLSTDTSATRSCSSDPDMGVNLSHWPVPNIWVDFRRSRSRGFDNTQRDWYRLCCWCCGWCVSLSRMCS